MNKKKRNEPLNQAVSVIEKIKQLSFCYGIEYMRKGASEQSIVDWLARHHENFTDFAVDIDELGHQPVLFHWFCQYQLLFTTEGVFRPFVSVVTTKIGKLNIIRLKEVSCLDIVEILEQYPDFEQDIKVDLSNLLWRIANFKS